MKAIQEWLGHSNFSTTANLYAHLEYESKLDAARAIGNKLIPCFGKDMASSDQQDRALKEKEPLEQPA